MDEKISRLLREVNKDPQNTEALAHAKNAIKRIFEFSKDEMNLLLYQFGTTDAVHSLISQALYESHKELCPVPSAIKSSAENKLRLEGLQKIGNRQHMMRRDKHCWWQFHNLRKEPHLQLIELNFFNLLGNSNLEQAGALPIGKSATVESVAFFIDPISDQSSLISIAQNCEVGLHISGDDPVYRVGPDAILNSMGFVYHFPETHIGVAQNFYIGLKACDKESLKIGDARITCRVMTNSLTLM